MPPLLCKILTTFTDYTYTPRQRGDVRAVGREIPRGWPYTSNEGWPCTRQLEPEEVDVGVHIGEVDGEAPVKEVNLLEPGVWRGLAVPLHGPNAHV